MVKKQSRKRITRIRKRKSTYKNKSKSRLRLKSKRKIRSKKGGDPGFDNILKNDIKDFIKTLFNEINDQNKITEESITNYVNQIKQNQTFLNISNETLCGAAKCGKKKYLGNRFQKYTPSETVTIGFVSTGSYVIVYLIDGKGIIEVFIPSMVYVLEREKGKSMFGRSADHYKINICTIDQEVISITYKIPVFHNNHELCRVS